MTAKPDTEDMVRELYAKQQIREVLCRYARGVNRVDKDLMRSIYSQDSWEVHGNYEGPGQGWADLPWRDNPGRKMVHHHLGQSLIELDGNSAFVETYFITHTLTSRSLQRGGQAAYVAGDAAAADDSTGQFTALMIGRFLDRFEYADNRWSIRVRNVIMDFAHEQPAESHYPIMDRYLTGERFPDDLVYHMHDFEIPSSSSTVRG